MTAMLNPYLKLGRRRAPYTGLAVLTSILMFAVMGYHGAPLKEPKETYTSTPRGIVDLELCWTADRANRILESWNSRKSFRDPGAALLEVAIENTWLDFGFIVIYSTAVTLFCGYAATRTSHISLSGLLIVLSWGQPVAGCLDAIENISMLLMLYEENVTGEFPAVVTTICAGIKFSLIGMGSLPGLGTIAFGGFPGEKSEGDK